MSENGPDTGATGTPLVAAAEDIRAAIATALGPDVDLASITDDSGPGTHERWDSLATIAVVAALEELVGHQLDLDELAFATTVADFVAIVQRARTGNQNTPPTAAPAAEGHTTAAAPALISTLEAA